MRILLALTFTALLVGCATPPAHTADATRFGPEREAVLPFSVPCSTHYIQFQTGDVYHMLRGPADPGDPKRWRRAEATGGLDAIAFRADDALTLKGRGCVFTQDARPHLETFADWDNLTPQRVADTWHVASWVYGIIQPKTADLPRTYFFRTARGEIGIVQFTAVVDHPDGWRRRGVRLRYKLVEPSVQ